ncbi:MAG: FAD-binding oxidoreductase [Candidatus Yanofskybacteria bacterium]|nr:FAD-binding oxidoreductase [Candidatus Yanofskybacteria bacterium]
MSNQIGEVVKGEVITDNNELKIYSRDASIFEIKPQLIVKPKDAEDIKNLVKFVGEHKSSNPGLSITARAGGSDMTGGPLNESIILDFTAHMNKILYVEERPPHAVVEPGAFYRDFEKETLKKNLLLPSYPASRELAAVGGMVANNAGGEKSLRYGKTADYVEELNVVLSDGNEYVFKSLTSTELEQKKIQNDFEGEIYRQIHQLLITNYQLLKNAKPDVSKNSAGYALWNVVTSNGIDLTKLFVGSQGTLGIITKIKFRLIKPAKYSQLLVIFLKDLDKLGDLVNELNEYEPESVESYDDNTIKLAFKILPDLIKKIGIGVLFRFIPDAWAIATKGIPKLVILAEVTPHQRKQMPSATETAFTVTGQAGESERDLKTRVQKIKQEIESKFKVRTRIASSKADIQKYWTIRRESFNLLRKHVKGRKTAPFIDDIIVKPQYLPEFLPELNQILDEYKAYMLYTIAGHPGDGNFHIIPLMNLEDEKSRQIIPELSERVYNLVIKYGGSITAEHNDGLIRTPYLEKMYGTEVYGLFEKVKDIFDPQNIFNPGKKVRGDLAYAIEHIKTD